MYVLRSALEDREYAMFGFKTPGLLVLALSIQAAGAAGLPAPRTISLERDCNGCAAGSRLVLQADGRAQLTTLGKARMGTPDQLREGRISIEAFAALARLAWVHGFFELPDEIADPQEQDGPWLLLRIECTDGRAKAVFNRGDRRPAALAELLAAIEAASRDIHFNPPPEVGGEERSFGATPR